MKRKTRRRLFLAAIAAVLFLNLSCLSFHFPREGMLVGPGGEALPGALIFYSYRGDSYNPACSSSYLREGTVVRADDHGRFRIGGTIHFHRPYPLQGGTRLDGAVYSTKTHSLVPLKGGDDLSILKLEDHGQDPIRWHEYAERLLIEFLPSLDGAEAGTVLYRGVPLEERRRLCADLRAEWGGGRGGP